MKSRIKMRLTSVLLCFVMVFSMFAISPVWAYYEEPTAEGNGELETSVYDYTEPVGVTMQRLTGPCKTETDNLGDDFLFVIKKGGRYYAMKDVAAREASYKSIPAVDVTDWVNPDGSLTVPKNTQGVAFWRYEERYDREYGVAINGRDDFLEYTSTYESVDGDDDYWNDADRNYTADFVVRTFEEVHWIFDPYYYSINNVSGTLKFNGSWEQKISSYNYVTHTYDMIVDLRSDGNGGKEFYFRFLGTDVEYTGEEVEGYLYYSDCRHQFTVRHAEYDAPTCMLKGCEEYWYCEGCNEYMKNENFNEYFGQEMPVIPAFGHDWDSEKCKNCNRPVPVYSKVTNQADFNALADDTMYVLIAEYGGKYYTPDVSEMYLYMMDSNEDGFNDIYDIDDNNNGISDMFEIDGDEDGIYDYLSWDCDGDGSITEIDMLDYHEQLCMGYLSDKMYGTGKKLPVREVNINSDGTISHEAVKGTVEFEMVDLYTDEEIDGMIEGIKEYEDWWSDDYRYTYECMKQFVIPNMFVSAPSLLPIERQYKQRIAQVGDTYSWGVLFANNSNDYTAYDYDTESAIQIPLHNVCENDSAVIFSSFDYWWYQQEHQLGQLRIRDYNGEISFVTGQAWELDGWEYVEDPITGEGYYDTHDTQACVYLYASQQPSHICEFGDWVEDIREDTHTRTCIDDTCGKTETKSHSWNNGVEIKAPNCSEIGKKEYTCKDCGVIKTEDIDFLGHEWSDWTDDGEHATTDTHTRSCKRERCSETEQVNHSWDDWLSDDEINHKKTCSVCSGMRKNAHKWDDGVVTTQPTEDSDGVKTYTCSDCGYTKTEPIDKLEHVHNWSDWIEQDTNSCKRECIHCGAYKEMTLQEDNPVNITLVDNAVNAILNNTDIELINTILNNEEQSQLAEGTDVKIYLQVEDISNEVSATHKAEVESNAGDDEIGMYLDINLFKQVGNDAETKITETDGVLTITITIPENLINTDASVTRTYKIIRVHEDENGNLITDVIEGVFNPEDNSFTFETDKFSTYALTYKDKVDSSDSDKPTDSENKNKPIDSNDSKVPQTGDDSNLLLWLVILLVVGVEAISITVYGKRGILTK